MKAAATALPGGHISTAMVGELAGVFDAQAAERRSVRRRPAGARARARRRCQARRRGADADAPRESLRRFAEMQTPTADRIAAEAPKEA